MMDRIMAGLAYAILVGFLVTLVIYVPRWDLGGVILLTLLLAGYDTLQVMRRHRDPSHETVTEHDPRDDA
ncbi:hypothetical protein [Paracoccus tegillarcae]|uniref:Uncharacterized protein n=1 Tax=Paracoccus tegillarcae TaxID=1529068 RepID=A0A2K9EDF0_9RHOB|nr:hypothetical protein [Paracoccus tegillarcae]AUH32960.1 hypothetical protein CUV01_05725 [Paracoccus tegillarcae]